MANFEIAFKRTGANEGGYTDDPDDNGNWTGGKKGVGLLVGTNFGFTAPELMEYLGRTPTKQEMQNLSIDVVKKAYRTKYWNKVRGDEIELQEAANELYDMAINAGKGTGIKLAERSEGAAEDMTMDDRLLNQINGNV